MAVRKTASKGGKPDKLMKDAIRLALHEEARNCNGKPTKKLYQVAAALVDKAIEGDVAAIREINDRIDGRVPQTVSGDPDAPHEIIIRWADDSKS